jgi:hypothetical protein
MFPAFSGKPGQAQEFPRVASVANYGAPLFVDIRPLPGACPAGSIAPQTAITEPGLPDYVPARTG